MKTNYTNWNFGNASVIFETKFSMFVGVRNLWSLVMLGAFLWFWFSVAISFFRPKIYFGRKINFSAERLKSNGIRQTKWFPDLSAEKWILSAERLSDEFRPLENMKRHVVQVFFAPKFINRIATEQI